MIKNNALLIKKSAFPKDAKKALQIIEAGLKAADVSKAVKEARLPSLNQFENVYVIGFGKACPSMAEALEKRLGRKIKEGCVIGLHKAKTKIIRSFVGIHPFPSKKNIVATKKILSIAKKAGKKDLVIVLESGGGSSLLTMPAKGISLESLAKTNKLLVKSKANIEEINIVRKHLSRVKGGQLMQAVYPARLYSLIVSDVVEDKLSTISSGPTVGDKSSFKQAIQVLKKHKLWSKVSKDVRERLSKGIRGKVAETPRLGNIIFKKAKNRILLNNKVALKAMKEKAKALGFRTEICSNSLRGEAGRIGKKLVSKARAKKKPFALIAGGETIVDVKGKGVGGRNQEMVLANLKELAKSEKIIFVSIGSDGVDGNSRAAGAIADSKTLGKRKDWKKFLKRNDSNSFFRKIRGEIVTGLTGTNVMDLQLVLKP